MAPNPLFGPKKRVRMRDVATRCGVSISTVSLVLSGDGRIPEDTTRKVLQTVKAMEYRPSVIARSLARRGSRTVGVILPEYAFVKNKPFYYQALQGIHNQTQPSGYKMIVEAANRVFLERRYYLRLLKEQSTDGIIYMAATKQDLFLEEMIKEPYPFVLLASNADGVNVPCAKTDDVLGAKMATQHLISLGHKAIGHVAGIKTISNGYDRFQGYSEAMKEAGLEVKPAWVVEGEFDMQTAEKFTFTLMKENITAIFVGSDVMAYGVLRALRTLGKKVPEDVAVVGMDDLEMSAWTNPALTTVRYDISLMAGLAAKFVIKQVQTPIINKNLLGEMPAPELVIRQSCGAKK